jgi:hypothetical protein
VRGGPCNDNAGTDSAPRWNYDKEFEMPFVNVKVAEGVKGRPVTWGIGGTPLHTADVLALAAGQPVG